MVRAWMRSGPVASTRRSRNPLGRLQIIEFAQCQGECQRRIAKYPFPDSGCMGVDAANHNATQSQLDPPPANRDEVEQGGWQRAAIDILVKMTVSEQVWAMNYARGDGGQAGVCEASSERALTA